MGWEGGAAACGVRCGEDITSEQDNHTQAHTGGKQNSDTDSAHQRRSERYVQTDIWLYFGCFEENET